MVRTDGTYLPDRRPLQGQPAVGKLPAMLIARSSLIVSRFVFQFALGTAQVVFVLVVLGLATYEFARQTGERT